MGWRVSSLESLQLFEKQLGKMNIPFEWVEGGKKKAVGDAIHFNSPAGLPIELYWEKELFIATDPKIMSKLTSHPSKSTGKGISPSSFVHVNILVNYVKMELECEA